MNHASNIRRLAVINHILSVLGIWYIIQTQNASWAIVSIIMFAFTAIVSVNIALHRYLSHKSFSTGPIRRKFLIYSSIISAFGSPVSWCAMHRYHHITSGGAEDNQSPKNIGFIRAWLTLYTPVNIPLSLIKDVLKDTDCKFIHNNYFKLLAAYVTVLFLINPLLVIFAFSIPAALAYQAAGAFAVIPHNEKFGYKVLPNLGDDDSVNSPLASILSLGEGWHNYHHSRPGDYRHGHLWWELDPPAWVIEKVFKVY